MASRAASDQYESSLRGAGASLSAVLAAANIDSKRRLTMAFDGDKSGAVNVRAVPCLLTKYLTSVVFFSSALPV